MNIIEIKNLTISIAGRKILNDVSLSLERGKVTALVGESGSGKTMTALSLLTLLPKTAIVETGDILFDNTNILSLSEREKRKLRGRKISMVFQEPFLSLNPVMKIGTQVEEAFMSHENISKKLKVEKVRELLSILKLSSDIVCLYPHEISGGMRQRVLIAIAIACNPEVLILDEPTTALDVSIQKEILFEIKKIKEEKDLTVLFISHDFSVVNLMADRIGVMKDGQVVEFGEKQQIINRPENIYTKQLIECIPRLGDKRDRLPEFRD